MAKFAFRLDTLLRVRRHVRDQRRAELAQAYQAEALLRDQEEQLARELESLHQADREACQPGPLNLDRLLEARRYALVLEAYQADLLQKRQLVEAEIERRRQVLVEATRDVRVLELLRQRQWERFRQEENRQETKILDEMALRRQGREEQR